MYCVCISHCWLVSTQIRGFTRLSVLDEFISLSQWSDETIIAIALSKLNLVCTAYRTRSQWATQRAYNFSAC